MGRSTPWGQNFCLNSPIKAINYPEITIPKNTINRNNYNICAKIWKLETNMKRFENGFYKEIQHF